MEILLCIHKYINNYLNLVDRDFCLKAPLDLPMIYLGEDISKFVIPNNFNGATCWYITPDSHVNKALQVVESKLKEENVW